MRSALVCLILLGCGKSKDVEEKMPSMAEMKSEAAVEWAQKQLPEIDKELASTDPGRASSSCAVIKPDLKAIEKADAKLAETLRLRCGHDLRIRELAVDVDRAEVARKAATGASAFVPECSSVKLAVKEIAKGGWSGEPDVTALVARGQVACPAGK